MVDSMHQSWLPRVLAAAFPRDGAQGPAALLQRRQPRAVTAARYLVPSSALRAPLRPSLGPGGWPARPRWPSQHLPPFQHLLPPDASAEAAVLSDPDPEPREAAAARPLPASALLHRAGTRGPRGRGRGRWLRWEVHLPRGAHGEWGTWRVPRRQGTGVPKCRPSQPVLCPQHHYVPCSLRSKPLVVLHLILHLNFSRVLCFTNSRENSHRWGWGPGSGLVGSVLGAGGYGPCPLALPTQALPAGPGLRGRDRGRILLPPGTRPQEGGPEAV